MALASSVETELADIRVGKNDFIVQDVSEWSCIGSTLKRNTWSGVLKAANCLYSEYQSQLRKSIQYLAEP